MRDLVYPFRSYHRYARSTLGSGRNPFCPRRVRSHQATTADPQSIAAAVTQPTFFRSPCCRAVCFSDSSRPSDPFRHRSEAFDSLKSSPSSEESKDRLLFSSKRRRKPGPMGPSRELIEAVVQTKRRIMRLSTNRSADCPGFRHPNRQRHGPRDSRIRTGTDRYSRDYLSDAQ